MNAVLTFLILAVPLTAAGLLVWTANRSDSARLHLDQFRSAAPMSGRLFNDPDADRVRHEADAIRTRYEHHPSRRSSAASGDRR